MHIPYPHKKTLVAALSVATIAVATPFALAQAGYLLLSPWSGTPGSSLSVEGHQFDPNENLSVSLGSTSTNATTDNSGRFTTTLTIPQQAPSTATVHASGEAGSASTQLWVAGYYPNAEPSTHYALPGQTITWSGSGFAPGESVTLSGPGGTIASFDAAGGSFSGAGSYTVPHALQGGTHTFHLESSTTGHTIVREITVGTFYPNLAPSSYYIVPGQNMSASATGFAPSEMVELYVNGTMVAEQAASDGSTTFNFSAPTSGSSFTLEARGTASHTSSVRTVTLAQY